MRIALMTNNYKPVMGGVPISIERLARGLRERGHEVTIFAPSYEGEKEEEGVFRYKTIVKHFYGGTVIPNSLDPKIEKEFRRNRYDVIHVHHPVLIGDTAVYISKKYDIPLTFTYHTRYEQYLSYAGLIRKIETASKRTDAKGKISGRIIRGINQKIVPGYISSYAKQCDFVFAPTPGMSEYLNLNCNVPKEKLMVLPTGLEKDEYEGNISNVREIRRRYIKSGEFLFVSVSRIAHEKNIEFLIESMRRLKQKTDIPFKLLFIGEGPEKENCEKYCRDAGLKEIDFVGQVPNSNIKDYCRAADAFLFASKSETQGIVIIEALAVGTPVIAVDASGVRDIVKSGENGILTFECIDDYVQKLYSYMRGEINIDSFSENAVRTALEYREENVAVKAENAYRMAIENRKRLKQRKNHAGKVQYSFG